MYERLLVGLIVAVVVALIVQAAANSDVVTWVTFGLVVIYGLWIGAVRLGLAPLPRRRPPA